MVRSSKTEHHEGGESRNVPLFPELRPYLEAAFDDAEPGTEHVITRYLDPNTNLRTQLLRIIKRAGLNPWPKLFQNLRASRATELANEHPAHVAAAWLGHSTLVANKHYWQVTVADFERASYGDKKVAQNPAQHTHISGSTDSQEKPHLHKNPLVLQVPAASCETVQTRGVGGTGLEPVTSTV